MKVRLELGSLGIISGEVLGARFHLALRDEEIKMKNILKEHYPEKFI